MLGSLPAQVLELLATEDPSTRRLFPVAYPGDAAAEREYRALMGESLADRHRLALDTLTELVDAETLTEAELEQWMSALEVLRLVIGTKLDVSEDMTDVDAGDPRAAELTLYAYLSMVQEEIVSALAGQLPATGEDG